MLSVNDICKKYKISRQRIDLLIKEGKLKASRFGKNMYAIEEKDFEEFLKNKKKNTGSKLK